MSHQLLILPGDGIGPEVAAEAEKVLIALRDRHALDIRWSHALIGGSAFDATGEPLPQATIDAAKAADAVLLGAVGGPKYDTLPREKRPERGLLGIRAALGLFANLRPAILHPELASRSLLRPATTDFPQVNDPQLSQAKFSQAFKDKIQDSLKRLQTLDILIVRELTGGIYFGEPRGIEVRNGQRVGFNTEVYSESEIERIARVAFEAARRRSKHVCSVDKANVLESSELWREVVIRVGKDFPDVTLTHQYVDNAAMQLVRAPQQFDVIVTSNLFGDILSDLAAQLTGSIGMLPSASLNESAKGLYEPIHGSAPDIAGKSVANPLAMIGSIAMLLRYSLNRADLADVVETAIRQTLASGRRTGDIAGANMPTVSTSEMGDAVVSQL